MAFGDRFGAAHLAAGGDASHDAWPVFHRLGHLGGGGAGDTGPVRLAEAHRDPDDLAARAGGADLADSLATPDGSALAQGIARRRGSRRPGLSLAIRIGVSHRRAGAYDHHP